MKEAGFTMKFMKGMKHGLCCLFLPEGLKGQEEGCEWACGLL